MLHAINHANLLHFTAHPTPEILYAFALFFFVHFGKSLPLARRNFLIKRFKEVFPGTEPFMRPPSLIFLLH